MNIVKLETQEQFEQLQKSDVVIVKWKKSVRQYKELGEITHHNSYTINRINELILNVPRNDYFSTNNYLTGESWAEEVYVVNP
ncbi:hypothetical protein [Bacillus thuringiensis]|uniref:hypothetical protein n=1 Tax=Bacillus thuringiensis TaxID=1428 RepID=UPI000BF75F78|nr:hypothetical protein [Bacillus thuringiensis]PEY75942.1 hypothetical protein CN355_04390 [Bacillus thuringiensis]